MAHVDSIEAFLRERRERLGDDERERQRRLRYCDGSKQHYAQRMGYDPSQKSDVRNPRCLSEWCDTRVSNKGYCVRCFSHLFPGEKVSRNYRTKERAVTEAIQEHYSDFDWVSDSRVSGDAAGVDGTLLATLGATSWWWRWTSTGTRGTHARTRG